MASIKKLDERRYKITVSNGYRPNGKKISKAKTIQVPPSVPKRGIGQYVAHAAEELERIRGLRHPDFRVRVISLLYPGRKTCKAPLRSCSPPATAPAARA